MYAALATRPDIAYALSVISQYSSNPGEVHWKAAKRLLRYLQGTANLSLLFEADPESGVSVVGYADADWAGDHDTRRSQSGYTYAVGGGTISWASKKQKTVALSSCEAEYISASLAAQEAIWLRRLVSELGYEQPCVTIYEDNTSAIDVSRNPKFHSRMKHVDIRHHFLRDCVEEGRLVLKYIRSEEQVADILTKGLPREKFEYLRDKLGVKV